MNFLNPLALFGMLAASVPLVLHLLNLRKLRTVEFGTLRFLQELQQTRVRKLNLQRILLLILRILIIAFAVLAFARPTIEGSLPLLGSTQRSSVLVLMDNSASMEAADQRGQRFRQAQQAVRTIIAGLQDGDEVLVLPLAGMDARKNIAFTRTFAVAREQADKIQVVEDRADLPRMLRLANGLMDEAAHVHREIYIVTDAQKSITYREPSDSGAVLHKDASIFLVRIGEGQRGLEQNLSVDSVKLLTRIHQPDKPVELEAWIRNGSERDAQGVVVSLAFDGRRVAQRAIDVAAGATQSVVVSAQPQRRGAIAASVELDNDAIDRDNVRYAGVIVPPRPRVVLAGTAQDVMFARTSFSLPGMEGAQPLLTVVGDGSAAAAASTSNDVVMICGGTLSDADAGVLRQWVSAGGGLVLFASDDVSRHLPSFGFTPMARPEATDKGITLTTVDRAHPLYQGVFKGATDERRAVESPTIRTFVPASGGLPIVNTTAGAFLSEAALGNGRVIYIATPPTLEGGTFPISGLFAATMVRVASYLHMPRDAGMEAMLGEPVAAPVPPRRAADPFFYVQDVTGVRQQIQASRLPSATMLSVPPQYRPGVVRVTTADSAAVMTIAVNAPTTESRLDYFEMEALKKAASPMVTDPEHIVAMSDSANMQEAIAQARMGSELWPLFIVLSLLCAVLEMIVSRLFRETAPQV